MIETKSTDLVEKNKDFEVFYTKVAARAEQHRDSYVKSQKSNQQYEIKYQKLIDAYMIFIEGKEGFSPFIYLDSPGGYPTVGYGHLLHFKYAGTAAKKLCGELKNKIPKNLTASNLKFPQEIHQYLSLSFDDIFDLYQDTDVCLGLLDAWTLPFEKSVGKMSTKKVVTFKQITPFTSEKEKKLAIFNAYNELLQIGLKMKARSLKYGLAAVNLFAADLFYTYFEPPTIKSGCNDVVISEKVAQSLAKKDMAIKLKQLMLPIDRNTSTFTDFSSYPESVQLALLELSYNAGVAPLINNSNFKRLVINKEWEKLAGLPQYPKRSDPIYQERNNQVRSWFKKAAEDVKKQKRALP